MAAAVADGTHVLGYVSEKPAAHAVQMPPTAAPAVQAAQLLAQSAHVPAKRVWAEVPGARKETRLSYRNGEQLKWLEQRWQETP